MDGYRGLVTWDREIKHIVEEPTAVSVDQYPISVCVSQSTDLSRLRSALEIDIV
jgi:hypothetical protein